MAAPEGNQFWRSRSKHGRDKIFSSPEDLWSGCCEYFDYVEENPLLEEKVFHHSGQITKTDTSRMRAMTLAGLCLFLDIDDNTWFRYRDEDQYQDFWDVAKKAEAVIYQQKFSGAAADMLNANIIARDLGLKDHTKEEKEVTFTQLSDKDLEKIIRDE